ncbi:DCR1C-like protein [Mya arenaria]|uniref:DCR1C-like protein n=1 Tax=Mya arenaria TaxID=6604 RepID=A0ABY7FXT2_MYAAR|nr:DCR1C-like protein [Mya arenaria]
MPRKKKAGQFTCVMLSDRHHCIDAVYELVREWTLLSPQHVVYIYLRAQYGHEPLLNAVAARLNKKVHVSGHKFEVYENIIEFAGNFTNKGRGTQIHACDKNCTVEVDGSIISCKDQHDPDKVLVILPTTMYFTQYQHITLDKMIKKMGDNFYRACYSFHSSYTEVKDLLSYLKPDAVFSNVKTLADATLAENSESADVDVAMETKELGTLKTVGRKAAQKRKTRVSTSESESLDFGTPVKQTRQSLSQPESPSPSVTARRGKGRGRGRGKAESQGTVATRRSTRRSAVAAASLDEVPSWSVGSFLAAVSSSSEDDTTAHRVCVLDDDEQGDEDFEDVSQNTMSEAIAEKTTETQSSDSANGASPNIAVERIETDDSIKTTEHGLDKPSEVNATGASGKSKTNDVLSDKKAETLEQMNEYSCDLFTDENHSIANNSEHKVKDTLVITAVSDYDNGIVEVKEAAESLTVTIDVRPDQDGGNALNVDLENSKDNGVELVNLEKDESTVPLEVSLQESASDDLKHKVDDVANEKEIKENLKEKEIKEEKQDDDAVIEIVDLTGDDFGVDRHAINTPLSGKKPIKISFGKSKDQIMKAKQAKETNKKIVVEEVIESSDSDTEWLSCSRGKETDAKKPSLKRTRRKDKHYYKEKQHSKKSEQMEETAKVLTEEEVRKQKEIEELKEIERQAVGFMLETDSESDIESSDPESPPSQALYDDYVELSSGDDGEKDGGVGGNSNSRNGRSGLDRSGFGDIPESDIVQENIEIENMVEDNSLCESLVQHTGEISRNGKDALSESENTQNAVVHGDEVNLIPNIDKAKTDEKVTEEDNQNVAAVIDDENITDKETVLETIENKKETSPLVSKINEARESSDVVEVDACDDKQQEKQSKTGKKWSSLQMIEKKNAAMAAQENNPVDDDNGNKEAKDAEQWERNVDEDDDVIVVEMDLDIGNESERSRKKKINRIGAGLEVEESIEGDTLEVEVETDIEIVRALKVVQKWEYQEQEEAEGNKRNQENTTSNQEVETKKDIREQALIFQTSRTGQAYIEDISSVQKLIENVKQGESHTPRSQTYGDRPYDQRDPHYEDRAYDRREPYFGREYHHGPEIERFEGIRRDRPHYPPDPYERSRRPEEYDRPQPYGEPRSYGQSREYDTFGPEPRLRDHNSRYPESDPYYADRYPPESAVPDRYNPIAPPFGPGNPPPPTRPLPLRDDPYAPSRPLPLRGDPYPPPPRRGDPGYSQHYGVGERDPYYR